MNEAAFIGIDAGGNKTRGLAIAEGQVISARETPTDISGAEAVLQGILRLFRELAREAEEAGAQVAAWGVGIAGYIDFSAGTVTLSPNLPLRDLPLRDLLQEATGLPVMVDNDANAAALAENRLGAGRGCRHQVHLTLGTGIGGGLIIDGRLYRGASGSAAELGHLVILEGGPQTACGHSGCLEALASGSAIEREARELLKRGWRPPGHTGEGLAALGARELARAAREKDPEARKIWERAGHYLGVGTASLINAFNPEAVTFSGGLTAAWDLFGQAMLEAVGCYAVPLARRSVKIERTTLKDRGGAMGAALMAEEAAGGR